MSVQVHGVRDVSPDALFPCFVVGRFIKRVLISIFRDLCVAFRIERILWNEYSTPVKKIWADVSRLAI